MTFDSKICRGKVVHERLTPVKHAFTYPITFFCFDLKELSKITQVASLFTYNSPGAITLWDKDYLNGNSKSIKNQVDKYLGFENPEERTILVTSPRYFGKAFNPVNFHLRLRGSQLLSVVAEVNNTFGDRHIYPLTKLEPLQSTNTWTARCSKEFHVSPFNNLEGEYRFTFRIDPGSIFLGVDLYKEGNSVMKTWIQGEYSVLNNTSITKYALLHPFDTALNSFPRILWQAAVLYYKRKLPVFKRPSPHSEATIIDRDAPKQPRTII